jgi:predicted dehydrogenase
MSEKKVRIALVGTGNVAQVAHIPAYLSMPNVELAALVDEDLVKCKAVQKQYGVPNAYDDFTVMLEKEDVDAVDVCTPNYLHAPMAIAALRSGRHVLCEKPLARNAAEATKMVETARESNRILMVAMNNRFRRDVEVLRTFVRRGELGTVQLVRAGWQRIARDWHEREWFVDQRRAGGGALLDLGMPVMDLAIWVAGLRKPVRVTCATFGRKARSGVEDSACATVYFAGGSCLVVEVTWNLLEPKDHSYLEIHGTRGGGNLHPLKIHKAVRGHLVNVTPRLDGQRNYYRESYKAEIGHFVECVEKKKKPLTPGEEAAGVLKILDAMYESDASGKEVSFVP